MLSTQVEFSFIKLCLHTPQLFVIGFSPTDPMAQWCIAEVEIFRKKFGRYPTYDTYLEFIKGECTSQQYTYLLEKFKPELDKEFTQSKVIEFVEKTKLERALLEATQLVKEGKIREAKGKILQGTELIYSQTIDYFNFKREDYVKYKSVSTGFRRLNGPLGGGLHKQNLGLIIGPKSSGKSLTMVNFGANAAMESNGVLHISFEDSRDQLLGRYDTRFSGNKKPKGKLYIHNFPAGEATVADVEALINVYKPDLVLVDYLNEMGESGGKESRSEALGTIARSLRASSTRHECAIWTGQQAGRTAKFSDSDVTAESAFWSYEPSQVSDVVLTINQTKEEKANGKIRFLIDRNRNGADGVSLDFNISYEQMRLTDGREKF